MSQDISFDLKKEDGGEKERMCVFGRKKKEVLINLELEKEDEIDVGRTRICCFGRRKIEVTIKNEEKVEDVDQLINELKTYNSLNPWNWVTFLVTLITSGLGSWDVISDSMLGVQFLTSQEPVFGILTIFLTFLPGLKFYGYKKKIGGEKYSIAWFFACLFFPLTFLISKVGILYDQGPRIKNLCMYIASSEASTEAVLQLTLQVFIVLQGNSKASPMQIISIFTSTISISLVATEQLLLLTQNMKVLLGMRVVSYENLQLKEKWISIGKLLPFFMSLTIFRVTSLSMVTVLLGFYTPVMYTFLLLLLCTIEGIIGGRTKGVTIFRFWKDWMAQEGALSIISHTLTSVTSLVNDDTLPEIIRQVYWFVVNLTLVSGLSLPIYLDHFKIIPEHVLLFTNWHNLDVSASILFLSLVCTTILIPGVVSFIFFMLQINQIMKENITNLQMVHSKQNKGGNLEASGEKNEKTGLMASEPLAEKMKAENIEACGPKHVEPLAEKEVVVFVKQDTTSSKRNIEDSVCIEQVKKKGKENKEMEEELTILYLIMAENHKQVEKYINQYDIGCGPLMFRYLKLTRTDRQAGRRAEINPDMKLGSFSCNSNKLLYEKLLMLKEHNRKIEEEFCGIKKEIDEKKEIVEHSEKYLNSLCCDQYVGFAEIENLTETNKEQDKHLEEQFVRFAEIEDQEGLNIKLKKELNEKRKASELLETLLATILEEYKLDMKEEIKQLNECIEKE